MLLLLLSLIMAACEKVTNVTGGINEDYEPVGVTVGLSVSGYKIRSRPGLVRLCRVIWGMRKMLFII